MLWCACCPAVKTLGVVKDLGGGKGEVMGVTWELNKTYCVLLVQWQASFILHQSLAFVLYATLNQLQMSYVQKVGKE